MEEWKLTKIGSICKKVCSGGTPKSTVKEYYGGGIPWLNTKEVHFNRIYSTESTITDKGLNNCAAKWIEANAVIIAMYGATTAKCAIGMIPMTTNQACCNLMIDKKKADYRFVYYAIANSYSILASLANGGAQQNLNAQVIKDFEILLPSLVVQKRVADVLSTLDDKIECNRRINDNLPYLIQLMALIILLLLKRINDNFEQQAQALFDKMFPQITKGDSTVGNMITPQRGKGLLSKNAIPGEVPVVAGGIEPATFHNVSNTTPPVLTIAASGANAGYINLWHIPVWSSDSSFIDSKMTSNVYFWYVMLKKRQKEIFDAQVGSAQPHIYPKHIAELPMQDVEENRLLDYNRIVTPVFKQIGKNVAENNRLASIRDVLLPKLMSGELKIS